MAKLTHITGVQNVITNMKAAVVVSANNTGRNLMRAGLFLQRESQKIVPVDTSNLKNGAFTRAEKMGGVVTDVLVGYTADYAVFVHEDMKANDASGKQAKFLEEPARTKRPQILRIIAKGR